MKLRRKEINVFSMSALDLFASGMGAFVLLAVMALPFFPNTGDSQERIEDIKEELSQAQAERDAATERVSSLEQALSQIQHDDNVREVLQQALNDALQELENARQKTRELQAALNNAENRANSLEEALVHAKMPSLDIVICLDVTASMTEQIEGLKREISVLAEILNRLAPSAGIGLVAFGDRTWMQPIHIQNIVPTSNLQRIESFIRQLEPNMDPQAFQNRDGPEMLATALERGIALNWRPDSQRRYVIVVTDNAAYPEREQAALQAARWFASAQGRYVATVRANFVPFISDRQAADRFLPELARAGNGQFVDAAGGESMIGSLLLAILGT